MNEVWVKWNDAFGWVGRREKGAGKLAAEQCDPSITYKPSPWAQPRSLLRDLQSSRNCSLDICSPPHHLPSSTHPRWIVHPSLHMSFGFVLVYVVVRCWIDSTPGREINPKHKRAEEDECVSLGAKRDSPECAHSHSEDLLSWLQEISL